METDIFDITNEIIWVEPDDFFVDYYDYDTTIYVHLTPPEEIYERTIGYIQT